MQAQPAQEKKLRDYQDLALAKIDGRFASGVYRQLLSGATGCGKTEIFSFLIKNKIEQGQNCLVLAHRDRLVTQAADRIQGIVGWGKVGLVNADSKNWWHPCVVATVQSAAIEKQLLKAPQFQNIIIDEAHRSRAPQYKRVIDSLLAPGGLLLGVTATPNRTDKKGLVPAVFEELIYEIGMQELIDKEHLCKVIGKEIKLPIDFSKIKTAVSTDGIRDYKPEEIKKAFEEAKWLERITTGWQEVASDRRTIVFVPPGVVDGRGCGMAHSLAEYMRLHGIRAAAVDGTTKQAEQDQIIAEFTSGEIQVLVNVNIFTEGLDIPPIDCVLFARPTQSSIIYSQGIGRGTRNFPGKKNLLVIDVTGITEQLAKDGQTLMTLGKILPTKEQLQTERAARIKAARQLIRRLWLKRITVKLIDNKLQVTGEIGPKDKKKLNSLEAEIREILATRDTASQEERPSGARRPVNTSLLQSDRIEIRDIDFTRAAMPFDWQVDQASRTASLIHSGIEFLIWRPDPDGEYYFADLAYNGGIEGMTATYQQAKETIERFVAEGEIRKKRLFNDRRAPWRTHPVSDGQRRMMERFRIPIPQGCTKGMASDLLEPFFNRNKRRA